MTVDRAAATARLGFALDPSVAVIDLDWLAGQCHCSPLYVELSTAGRRHGVLRVVDSRINSGDEVYLHPGAWLDKAPLPGTRVELTPVDQAAYRDWRKRHTEWRRSLLIASAVLTVVAGLIEASWSVGRFWDLWQPNDFWAGASHLAKWLLLGLGVGGIALWRDYRAIE